MTPDELRNVFAHLKVWHAKGWRAPNKPLLALWAIGRCLRNEARLAPYDMVAQELGILLRRFGPPRKGVNPDLPFWHLRNDGVWDIPEAGRITQTASGHAHISSLRREGAQGGLSSEIFSAFRKNKAMALDIAYSLVEAHFPESLHDDVLRAVGIDSSFLNTTIVDTGFMDEPEAELQFQHVRRRPRNPAFSRSVLDAYGDRCAVCEFSIRLRGATVALDAAHIRWHKAGGHDRDKISNGLALCALHHRLFDAGAFTLSPKYTIVVASAATGSGVDRYLRQFSQLPIYLPQRTEDYPNFKSLKWHHREVFGSIVEGIDY